MVGGLLGNTLIRGRPGCDVIFNIEKSSLGAQCCRTNCGLEQIRIEHAELGSAHFESGPRSARTSQSSTAAKDESQSTGPAISSEAMADGARLTAAMGRFRYPGCYDNIGPTWLTIDIC